MAERLDDRELERLTGGVTEGQDHALPVDPLPVLSTKTVRKPDHTLFRPSEPDCMKPEPITGNPGKGKEYRFESNDTLNIIE